MHEYAEEWHDSYVPPTEPSFISRLPQSVQSALRTVAERAETYAIGGSMLALQWYFGHGDSVTRTLFTAFVDEEVAQARTGRGGALSTLLSDAAWAVKGTASAVSGLFTRGGGEPGTENAEARRLLGESHD